MTRSEAIRIHDYGGPEELRVETVELREPQRPALRARGHREGVLAGIAERIPGARYAVLQGAPHMLFIEQPQAFAALVRDFLAAPGDAAAG